MKLPSAVLVALQFLFIAILATPLDKFTPSSIASGLGLIVLIDGIALAIWAAMSLRLNNFSVMPEPVNKGTLIQAGPYRWIRHPMYSAVIVCAVGAVLAQTNLYSLLSMLILVAVLWLKIQREESFLLATYPDYKTYRAQTSALCPYVY